MEVFQYYLMHSAINLHWDDEVCIADGLREDKKRGEDLKLVPGLILESVRSHAHFFCQKGGKVKSPCKAPQARDED